MKLSVIIVSYNEVDYIKQAVDSCLEQRFGYDYEIIIGDDGSDDGSIELIDKYSKEYPKLIRYFVMDRTNIQNIIPSIRVSNILREAFSLAEGEYIVVLSGDDFFDDKTKFQTHIEFLDNNKRYIACYSDYQKIWNDGKCKEVNNKRIRWNPLFWSYSYVHISCFIFRRTVLGNITERFFDDTGLIYAILKSGKCAHIPKVMFSYRQRDNSIMHKADQLELDILELLLFQDIINAGGFYWSSLSRFRKSLIRSYKCRYRLKDSKYRKYCECAAQYDNDILSLLYNYDSSEIWKKGKMHNMLLAATFSSVWFKIIRKFNSLLNLLKNN